MIPPWAKQAYEDWQSAIETTRRIQQDYNDWLAKLDQVRFAAAPSEPINEQLNRLLSLQIQYFQQITPWMDAKIHELRSEENHNVTFHVGSLLSQLNELQLQIAAVQRQVLSGITTTTPPEPGKIAQAQTTEKDFRYHAFEQIFRQPSDRLKESLRRYLPVFNSAPEPIVDLGCGRGEFLQLMKESGKNAYGVDFSQYEVEQINAAGLQAFAGDIQEHALNLEKESIGGVFCAQVVEHLHPDAVYKILSELHRAMKADAPLVIETVNPLSVFAYHHLFFKDPTHVFPVHPDTLVFMLRYTGFRDVQAHLITPVPAQQKLPEPKKEDFTPAAFEYLKTITSRLNDMLYDSLEYYVVGLK